MTLCLKWPTFSFHWKEPRREDRDWSIFLRLYLTSWWTEHKTWHVSPFDLIYSVVSIIQWLKMDSLRRRKFLRVVLSDLSCVDDFRRVSTQLTAVLFELLDCPRNANICKGLKNTCDLRMWLQTMQRIERSLPFLVSYCCVSLACSSTDSSASSMTILLTTFGTDRLDQCCKPYTISTLVFKCLLLMHKNSLSFACDHTFDRPFDSFKCSCGQRSVI